MFDSIPETEAIEIAYTAQPSPLHVFVSEHSEALINAAALLGGAKWRQGRTVRR